MTLSLKTTASHQTWEKSLYIISGHQSIMSFGYRQMWVYYCKAQVKRRTSPDLKSQPAGQVHHEINILGLGHVICALQQPQSYPLYLCHLSEREVNSFMSSSQLGSRSDANKPHWFRWGHLHFWCPVHASEQRKYNNQTEPCMNKKFISYFIYKFRPNKTRAA